MNVFEMSDRLIDKDEATIFYNEIVYYLPPKFSSNLQRSVLNSSVWTLNNYYGDEKYKVDMGLQHGVIITEILRNARWHGGSNDDKSTFFGLFFNKENLILGCNDGGDYFKREDIKEIWENKEELKEFHNIKGFGLGIKFGYSKLKTQLDKIIIDTKQGTFYGIVDVGKYLTNLNESNK